MTTRRRAVYLAVIAGITLFAGCVVWSFVSTVYVHHLWIP